ncbi:MAG: hypothetical protein R3B93_09785 [Bacteroidia bacterium]
MSCFVVLGYSQYYYIPYINAGTNPGGLNTLEEQPFGQGLDASWTIIHEGEKVTQNGLLLLTCHSCFI